MIDTLQAILGALGLLIGLLAGWPQRPDWCAPLLMTGLCGGFTTYSAFALDTHRLWSEARWAAAAGYAAATLAACLGAVAAGWALGRRLG